MDILAAAEGVAHRLVPGEMREQAQLDLGIVRVHEHAAGFGDERAADLAAHLRAHGDILQVRFAGGDAACGGDRLVKPGMDAPVAPRQAQEAVDIGAAQLADLAVEQDLVDHRMQGGELLQGFRVGGIAALGLLLCRQAERAKEHVAQLLGAVEVKGRRAAQIKDLRAQRGDLRAVCFAQALKLRAIHKEALALHGVERMQQRQLDIAVERVHLLRFERGAVLKVLVVERGGVCRRVVFARLRGEEIGHQLHVVNRGGDGDIPLRQLRHQPLAAKEHEAAAAAKERRERLRGLKRIKPGAEQTLGEGNRGAHAVCAGEGEALVRHHQRGFLRAAERLKPGGCIGAGGEHGLFLPGDFRHVCCGSFAGMTGRKLLHARDQGFELQPFKQRQRARQIAQAAVLKRLFKRHMARDRRDLLAHQAGHAAVDHLFALLALQVRFRVVKGVFDRAVRAQELDGRLFADARHARDVVARVAHQALEIGDLRGRDAEILKHLFRRIAHHVAHTALGIEHVARFAHQLHGVAVAGDQQGVNARLLAAARHRAQDIVGFKGGAGQLPDAHGRQALAHQIKLRAQLGRGGLAAGLVFAVILMAEGRAVQVKGDGEIRRLFIADDLEQHGKKAEYGVGVDSVFIGKRRQGVKRAVHQAVAVHDHKGFRHGVLP